MHLKNPPHGMPTVEQYEIEYTYRQEKDREFYVLCPLFLRSAELLKDNKREAVSLPYT